ncbi:hypothetical protein WMF18_33485 [Sorangium sp. So ce315]|uniref:hypothetical protein n=1 Tax=Sorangium sp. So ce315 TaxID=3133299 RepID=UPI003F60970C
MAGSLGSKVSQITRTAYQRVDLSSSLAGLTIREKLVCNMQGQSDSLDHEVAVVLLRLAVEERIWRASGHREECDCDSASLAVDLI